MSLITMGYCHLTVITMGLGLSFNMANLTHKRQPDNVTFLDSPSDIAVEDNVLSFQPDNQPVIFKDKSSGVRFK